MTQTVTALEACKNRIIRAIKKGNHDEKYIHEHITKGHIANLKYTWYMADAIRALKREGEITYNDNLEGWYLTQEGGQA